MDNPALTWENFSDPRLDTSVSPEFFFLSKSDDERRFRDLLESGAVREVSNPFEESVEDLFRISFPHVIPGTPEYVATFREFRERYLAGSDPKLAGVWAYFPWKGSLVHLLEQKDFHRLRTARNQFLITPEEQGQFYSATIGIAGLSVGSSVVTSLVLSGGARSLRIADLDTLAITNLNRLQASVCDLGRSKLVNAARRIYEMNPFSELALFPEGLSAERLDDFFAAPAPLDLFIEEMDNIQLKILSRFKARELRIPVVMATDNGDNAIIDVERFDLEPKRPLFHGSIEEEILRNVPAHPSMADKVRLASRIVGSDITPRTQSSLMQVGTKLPAWPQLGNAATLSGAAVSYVARRILTGQSMPSGRYEVSFDAALDPEFSSPEAAAGRAQQKEDFENGLRLLYG